MREHHTEKANMLKVTTELLCPSHCTFAKGTKHLAQSISPPAIAHIRYVMTPHYPHLRIQEVPQWKHRVTLARHLCCVGGWSPCKAPSHNASRPPTLNKAFPSSSPLIAHAGRTGGHINHICHMTFIYVEYMNHMLPVDKHLLRFWL